jgi:enoyl-CoA hydratase
MGYETILTAVQGRVAVVTLHRPQALNALNMTVMRELGDALTGFDADAGVGCIVIAGSEKAFAAGADIKEMSSLPATELFGAKGFVGWDRVTAVRKPLIAAVAGFALGGGCELAMMCDFIVAADNAKFGQPEIKLGVLPGMGGSQRLTRAIGKAKAMEMCLTGRMMDAAEAERAGLVARVVPAAELMTEVMKIAETIAGMSLPAAVAVKAAVNAAMELPLSEGLRVERGLFAAAFDTEDQKEGMAAFMEKRPASFKHR